MQHSGDNSSQTNRVRKRTEGDTPKEGLNRNVVRWMVEAPYLEREEEHELAQKWHGEHDDASLHKIASAHARLVVALAMRFKRFNLPLADLVQEGYVGLLEAAARFDPSREVRFSTYATWWIRASIQDYILRNWSIVRGGTSSAQKALFFNLRQLRTKISQQDKTLSKEEIHYRIANQLGVSVHDVVTMDARLSSADNSLDSPIGYTDEEGSLTGLDLLVDDAPLPDELAGKDIDSERRSKWLNEALRVLNKRELHVIRARRLGEEVETLEKIGEEMGLTKERVRQIEVQALEKLRTVIARHEQRGGACCLHDKHQKQHTQKLTKRVS